MPELPEVETVVRGLLPRLAGRRIVRADLRRADLREKLPPGLARRLAGRRVQAVRRRAKYILIDLDHDEVLLMHLGMSGRLVLSNGAASPPGPHDHLDLILDDGAVVRFSDPRRFGLVDLVAAGNLADDPRLRMLGPEPLSPEFDAATLAAALDGRRTAIKTALLDQRLVAGIGNIYACEALFRARLSPLRPAGTVKGARAERLVRAIRDVLNEAIAAGGSSARDYVQASGELGWFQYRWAVYDREHQPCPGCTCAGSVKRIIQGGRSTFYCPSRQR